MELLVSLDSKIEDLQDRISGFEALRNTYGWRLLVEGTNAFVRNGRITSFNNRIMSLEDAFKECDAKANIAGAQFVMSLAVTLEDEAKTNLEEALAEREEDHAS